MRGFCKDKNPKLYIGPWALAEDVGWSEDEKIVVGVLCFASHEYVASEKVRRCGPRRSISSDKRSTNQMYILSFKVTFQEVPLIVM